MENKLKNLISNLPVADDYLLIYLKSNEVRLNFEGVTITKLLDIYDHISKR